MMKKIILLASFLLTFVITQNLFAQNDQDVSTMNGQLVKVGERNQYQFSYKKTNISLDPIGVIVGNYFVSVSHAVHANIALKADLGYIYEPYGDDVQGVSVGALGSFYFKKMYSGFFLEPGVAVSFVDSTDSSAKATAVGPLMNVGHHWMWDSGLNLALAFGMQRNFAAGSDSDEFVNYQKFRVTGYLRAGWAF